MLSRRIPPSYHDKFYHIWCLQLIVVIIKVVSPEFTIPKQTFVKQQFRVATEIHFNSSSRACSIYLCACCAAKDSQAASYHILPPHSDSSSITCRVSILCLQTGQPLPLKIRYQAGWLTPPPEFGNLRLCRCPEEARSRAALPPLHLRAICGVSDAVKSAPHRKSRIKFL